MEIHILLWSYVVYVLVLYSGNKSSPKSGSNPSTRYVQLSQTYYFVKITLTIFIIVNKTTRRFKKSD